MKDITLHTNSKTASTCVSNAFIDHFMANANGEFVKIYLYLLRCMSYGDDFSISGIADKFEHTEKDILRALKYWEKMHVLQLEYKEGDLCGICILDAAPTEKAPEKKEPADAGRLTHEALSGETGDKPRPEYTKDQISTFQQKEDVQDLIFIAEKYLGHTLNSTDVNAILYWYDTLHFSVDLIEYLIEYCVDKGHRSTRYMDKVALGWAELGIRTVEQAKRTAGLHRKAYYAVMKAFGISGRNLVEFEQNFISKWTNEYGFSLDIIGEACKRTIQAIHQPSFEYADTILNSWKKNNVHRLKDISALDTAYQKSKVLVPKNISTARPNAKSAASKNRFTNYPQRSYDYTELEKQLLNRSMQ